MRYVIVKSNTHDSLAVYGTPTGAPFTSEQKAEAMARKLREPSQAGLYYDVFEIEETSGQVD